MKTIEAYKQELDTRMERMNLEKLNDLKFKLWQDRTATLDEIAYDEFCAGFDASTEHWHKIVGIYMKALDNIDDHIRQMRVDGIISMKEMAIALKVISDSLSKDEIKKQIGGADE